MARSSDSDEEFCRHVDITCTLINICKTCTRNLLHGTGRIHVLKFHNFLMQELMNMVYITLMKPMIWTITYLWSRQKPYQEDQ
jgi:hypothetical protein